MASSPPREKEKKRRRIIHKESLTTATALTESKRPKTDSPQQTMKSRYLEVLQAEEEELEQRDMKTDLEIHKAACDEFRKMMARIQQLKQDKDTDNSAEIEECRIHGSLQFITLKKLNRLSHLRCKKVRDATNEAKQQIDTFHLQLQNLLYEIMHLQKEITKCLEFKSKDEDIDLVSVEEFYKEAPEEISKGGTTQRNDHQQTLARLDWELEQRKRLAEKLKEANQQKEIISREIKTKTEYLESLQPKLNTILQSTKPVQDYLKMPFDEIREQHRTAHFLPRPLYVLYMQASAYRDACDKNLEVSLEGDVDQAKSLEAEKSEDEDESDSDQEEQEQQSKKRRRRTTAGERMNLKRQKVLKKHPLSVAVSIKSKDGSTLLLQFHYLLSLEIVTVNVKLTPGTDSYSNTIAGGDLMSPDSLLCSLYPGDTGEDTPNPSNQFALNTLGMDDFKSYIPEIGLPYLWVQWLSGLEYLNESEVQKAQAALTASHMEETIKRLRNRVRARLALQKQLAALERGTVPVSSEYLKPVSLFPTKIISRLTSWKRSTYEDFVSAGYTRNICGAGLVHSTDMFFVAHVERGSAKMTANIAVGSDYPNTAALFAVAVHWRMSRSSLNDENIRDLEAEVNIHHEELLKGKSRDQLLTNQVQRLLMCLDVYLETEHKADELEGPKEFEQEKNFSRLSRGPNRSKPYKFNPTLGFFSHR